MKSLVYILVLTIFMYLVGVFVTGTWDTTIWNEFGKYMYAFVYVFITCFIVMYEKS